MKLGKTALLALGIGIFIIVFVSLFTIYLGQSGEQEQLNDNLASAQSLLPKLIAEREDLASQLAYWEDEVARVQSALDKSEARFPKSAESIEYDEILFKLADECDLMIMELSASEPQSEGVKETDIIYTVTTLEVTVLNEDSPPGTSDKFRTYIDDTVNKVLEFIHIIATTEEFNVGTIKVVSMENLEPPEPEEIEEAMNNPPEATIEVIIYGFPR